MSQPLRLLLLEDSAEDTQRLREALTDGGFQPRITRAMDEDAFRRALVQGDWDAIVCDHDLARSGEWQVLAVVREVSSDVPCILVSRSMDFDTAAQAIADGARDYIEKTDLSRLTLSLMRESKATGNRTEQKTAPDGSRDSEAQQALQASEQRLRAILDNSPAAIFLKDLEGRLVLVNKAYLKRHNHTAEEVIGKTASEIFGKNLADQILAFEQRVLGGGGPSAEEELLVQETETGEQRVFLVNRFPIPGPDGTIVGIGGVSTEVTAQKQAEEDLRRSYDELELRVAERHPGTPRTRIHPQRTDRQLDIFHRPQECRGSFRADQQDVRGMARSPIRRGGEPPLGRGVRRGIFRSRQREAPTKSSETAQAPSV